MLSINTNISSLIAQSSMKQSTSKLNQAIERMTTGFKINHASDNAANYSISTNMTTKIGAYNVAEDNAAMGLDLISTAEGTLNQIQDKLERLRALAEQASNGTYGEDSLKAINAESNALVEELERLYQTAEYNGIKLFAEKLDLSDGKGVTGSFIKDIIQLTPDEATAQGYTIIRTTDELQNMTSGGKYILMNDIDLSGYKWTPIENFSGELNGNGYVIKNLTIKNPSNPNNGLLGSTSGNVDIKNLGIENSLIDALGLSSVESGFFIGHCSSTTNIENCYAQGDVASYRAGGLIGYTDSSAYDFNINSCYFDGNVDGKEAGGFVSSAYYISSITNSFVNGNITYVTRGGGFIAYTPALERVQFCYFNGTTSANPLCGQAGSIMGLNEFYYSNSGSGICSETGSISVTKDELQTLINSGRLYKAQDSDPQYKSMPEVSLQVGINNDSNSQLTIGLSFNLDNTKSLRKIGIDSSDFLEQIDNLLSAVSQKQTEYGAVSNRLESVLEEITIQRDNLISSRSTIRDADIAKVSSTYIQQQILQQASATLLATANQSPSIALQLI